jgi:hypothetical protein
MFFSLACEEESVRGIRAVLSLNEREELVNTSFVLFCCLCTRFTVLRARQFCQLKE